MGPEQTSICDKASVQVKLTVTSVLFHPLPLAGGAAWPLISGGVLSMLTVRLAEAVLPATSVTVPETTWASPSLVRVTGGGQEATGAPPSEQVKVTTTSVLFQPFALGSGDRVAAMVGAVLSMRTVRLAEAWLPARSTAVPVTSWAPSPVTTTGAGQVATCDRPSAQENVTVTSPLFQPL